ncbi:MAG: lysine exporter LysO family protein [Parabacteroides chartae]|nr:lysine exporter LysO family protein [Parabacteroides chartae]
MLFLLGISVGNNEAIVNNLPEIGGKAFLIAVSATLGSLICAWVVYRYFFKKEGES